MGCGGSVQTSVSDYRPFSRPSQYQNPFDGLPEDIVSLSMSMSRLSEESNPDESVCELDEIAPLLKSEDEDESNEEERVPSSYSKIFRQNRPAPVKRKATKQLYPPITVGCFSAQFSPPNIPRIHIVGTDDFDYMLLDCTSLEDDLSSRNSESSECVSELVIEQTESVSTVNDQVIEEIAEELTKIIRDTNDKLQRTKTKQDLIPVVSGFVHRLLESSKSLLEQERESHQTISMLDILSAQRSGPVSFANLNCGFTSRSPRCDIGSDISKMERYDLLNDNFKSQIVV